ncbi:MAG: TIGR02266 family protein [Sandaracinaceae bacterium]|nr:TIGR02266 family protein [Sandaracinaceae bacterium]
MSEGRDRRKYERYDTSISVDYVSGETFLFSYITNISEMGIFIRSEEPLPIGSHIQLKFATTEEQFDLEGEVVWINPMKADGDNINPGMGVRLVDLQPEERERVVALIRTVAYLRDDAEGCD